MIIIEEAPRPEPQRGVIITVCVCVKRKKHVNKVHDCICLDSSMGVSMVTLSHKQAASSVSITGMFHGSFPVSPPRERPDGVLEEASAERESTSVMNSINPLRASLA